MHLAYPSGQCPIEVDTEMLQKREFCTKGTGLGDNHISISADGVGMEGVAYREV